MSCAADFYLLTGRICFILATGGSVGPQLIPTGCAVGGKVGVTWLRPVESKAGVGVYNPAAQKAPEGMID